MTTRVVLGKETYGGTSVGLWVSKPGIEASTDTSPDHYLIHPSKVNLQPLFSGNVLTLPFYAASGPILYSDGIWRYSNSYRVTFAHGLDHIPMFFGSGPTNANITADTTNIIINASQGVAASPNTSSGANSTGAITLSFPFGYFVIRVFG